MCQNDSQAMKKMEGDSWDYEAVDVTDFLAVRAASYARPGVRGHDRTPFFSRPQSVCIKKSNGFRIYRMIGWVGVTIGLMSFPLCCGCRCPVDRPIWNVKCNWSQIPFQAEHVRPLQESTDAFEALFKKIRDKETLPALNEVLGVQVSNVEQSWSAWRRSLAVEITIRDIKDAHGLRDRVLDGSLNAEVNKALALPWEVGIDGSAFLGFYEKSLLSLTQLTEHQSLKMKELQSTSEPGATIHLQAAAGSGKTFLAVKYVLDHLQTARGKVLYVAPNRALAFHFVRWLLVFAHADMQTAFLYLQRLTVLCKPYDQLQRPVITGHHIELKAADFEPFELTVFDESHHIFSSETDPSTQKRLKIYAPDTGHTMLSSDISQNAESSVAFKHDLYFPQQHVVRLTEVVRSTQRIVAGAANFRLHNSEKEPNTHCLGANGPPLKTFFV